MKMKNQMHGNVSSALEAMRKARGFGFRHGICKGSQAEPRYLSEINEVHIKNMPICIAVAAIFQTSLRPHLISSRAVGQLSIRNIQPDAEVDVHEGLLASFSLLASARGLTISLFQISAEA